MYILCVYIYKKWEIKNESGACHVCVFLLMVTPCLPVSGSSFCRKQVWSDSMRGVSREVRGVLKVAVTKYECREEEEEEEEDVHLSSIRAPSPQILKKRKKGRERYEQLLFVQHYF